MIRHMTPHSQSTRQKCKKTSQINVINPLHEDLIERRNINLSGRMSRIDFTSPFCRIPRGQTLQQPSKMAPKLTSLAIIN